MWTADKFFETKKFSCFSRFLLLEKLKGFSFLAAYSDHAANVLKETKLFRKVFSNASKKLKGFSFLAPWSDHEASVLKETKLFQYSTFLVTLLV